MFCFGGLLGHFAFFRGRIVAPMEFSKLVFVSLALLVGGVLHQMQFLLLLVVLTVLVFCLTAVTVLFFFQTLKDLAIGTVVSVVGLVVFAKELKTFLVIGTVLGLFMVFL